MVAQWRELTDSQWEVIEKLFSDQELKKHSVRTIVDAILWIVRTGAQWRNLDRRFPPWQSVYYHFRQWKLKGKIEELNLYLVAFERYCNDREEYASLSSIDSQSIKTAPFVCKDKGLDGFKRINGRKRHILVDTMGSILGIVVGPADTYDGHVGCSLLKKCKSTLQRMKKVLADNAYRGEFIRYAKREFTIEVDISSPPPSKKGFVPVAWRWVVERTFGWLNFFRRLDKDHEKTAGSSACMVLWANIQIILSRFKQ